MRFAQQETRRRRVKVEAGVQGRQQLYCSLNLYFWSIRLSTIKPEIVFFPACHTKISKRKKKSSEQLGRKERNRRRCFWFRRNSFSAERRWPQRTIGEHLSRLLLNTCRHNHNGKRIDALGDTVSQCRILLGACICMYVQRNGDEQSNKDETKPVHF